MRLRLLSVLVLLAAPAAAQIEYGGAPYPPEVASRVAVPTLALGGVNRAELMAEDEAAPKGPFRFGVTLPVEVSLDAAGVWQTLADGTRVWRLRIESPEAFSLSFLFSRWQLAEGAQLFVYDDARDVVRGAYTWLNNKPNGQMAIAPVPGQALTLEYVEPAGVAAPGELVIGGVVHDYRDFYGLDHAAGAGRGGSCNVDVKCPQGAPWPGQIDATVQTILGGFICSAMLINNSANDGRQLVMSANHCGTMNNAVFRFKYQRSGCNSGGAPTNMTVQGSTQLATNSNQDFRLAQITPTIPTSYDPYFAGWNRSSTKATNTFGVHHPSGCPKKISFDNQSPARVGAYWRVLDWDIGTTEGGSSGSPLFDQNGRFIGQLCCGLAACGNNSYDEYGALTAYWGQVASVLDPLGTGATFIDGFDPNATPVTITGVAPSPLENLVPGTAETVTITGTGFQPTSSILIDGVPIAGTSSYVGPTSLKFQWEPLAALGTHTLRVENSNGMFGLRQVTVTGNAAPTVQIGNGDPFNTVLGFFPIALGGQPGDLIYLFASTSNAPSILPGVVTLDMGAAFTQLFNVGLYVVGANGLATDSLFTGGVSNALLYWQGVELVFPLASNYPLRVSNLQFTFTP